MVALWFAWDLCSQPVLGLAEDPLLQVSRLPKGGEGMISTPLECPVGCVKDVQFAEGQGEQPSMLWWPFWSLLCCPLGLLPAYRPEKPAFG